MRRWSLVVAAGALLAVGGVVTVPVSAAALRTKAHTVATGGGSAFDWASFHSDSMLHGYAPNSPLSTANASQLGVGWATDLYGAAVDSPVVSYDAGLGETLAYIGTENGDIIAVNVASGQILWANWLGSAIRSTPVVSGGSVYVGTFDSPRIYRLDATTGAVECSTSTAGELEGSPIVVTPPGGVRTLYFATLDTGVASGPLLAFNAVTCAVEWSFTGYAKPVTGSWDPLSYATDATGQPVVLLGTNDPDSSVYALNAVTGVEVWRFVPTQPPGDYDVGTGVTISGPGVNGFADGVAYVATKYGIMWAINLTTGAAIWSYNYDKVFGVSWGGISTAALDYTSLVFGYTGGIIDLNAITGALKWVYHTRAGAEVDSSPAIAGSNGSQIVAVGDLAGGVDVVSMATGALLYRYQTGDYITASPAVTDGNILVASSDGFLYDFALGGGNATTLPTSSISAPADTSTLANPNGSLSVDGAASDTAGVAGVEVAVQESGPDGPWWDASSRSWVSGPVGNSAVLASPGATSSGWTFSYPVPPAGGAYEVTAYAVSSSGQSDIKGAHSGFAVLATTTGSYLATTQPFVAPGSEVIVSGSGFADSKPITISLLGTTVATTTTTATGRIPRTKVVIPMSAVFGQTSLKATGKRSRTATAAITIANNWDEVGYGPSHTGFEPADNTFYNHITPGDDIFLDTAWRYQFGAPIDTAPAVADEVAYEGNTTGQLVAIDVHNGAPLWTWSLPSGAAIDGDPAVDPFKGLVFVGADDGTLDAVSTSTGKLVWSTSIGGDLAAPVYGDGEVYVTSSTGTVEAVVESTGAKSWAVVLGSAVSAAPSLDTVAATLVVGESNGTVSALATATGATEWTNSSVGAVTSATTISDGTVYFGSGDSVEAVNEATGVEDWSFPTSGPVTDSPALANDGRWLLIGSGDGNLYDLETSNGSLIWKVAIDHPIIGVATVNSMVVFDTSSGLVGAARTWAEPILLWKKQTGAGITSPPAIVDGTVYVGAGDWYLYAFTTYGQPPQ